MARAGAAALGLLLGLLAAAVVVVLEERSARDDARVALAGRLAAGAVAEPRLDRALLLARQAVRLENDRRTRSALLATVQRSPLAVSTFTLPVDARPLALAVHPGTHELLVTDDGPNLRTFDTRTHREAGSRLHGIRFGTPVTFSRKGSRVLLASVDPPALEVRDAGVDAVIATLEFSPRYLRSPTAPLNPATLSRDGRTAFYGYDVIGPNGAAYLDVWDARRDGPPRSRRIGERLLALAAVGEDRVRALTGDAVTTWDVRTTRQVDRRPLRMPERELAAAIDPTGRAVAWGDTAGGVTLLDLASDRRREAHVPEPVVNVAFAPDGRTLAITGAAGEVEVWDLDRPAPLALPGHNARVVGVAFDGPGRLFTASLDGTIFEWDLRGEDRFGAAFAGGGSHVPDDSIVPQPPLAVSADSERFVAAAGDGRLALFAVDDGRRLARLPIKAPSGRTAVAWSSANVLAVANAPGRVELWQVGVSARRIAVVGGRGPAVRWLAFSPDGRRLAIASGAFTRAGAVGGLAVYDVGARRAVGQRLDLKMPVFGAAFAPDGQTVALAADDGRVMIADVRSGRLRRTLRPIGAPSDAVAFAPDGTLLTGSWEGVVQRWKPSTGRQIGPAVLTSPAPVSTLAVAPGGDVFATAGGSDGEVKLWDLRTLQQVGTAFPGTADTWGAAVFTPDGLHLVQADDRRRGTVWPMTPAAWARHACAVAGRNLTPGEWDAAVGDREYERTC